MSIPKVFISYSHDTQEHKYWVLKLATRLRKTGIDAILDQWELKGGDDLTYFMETNLRESDYILMICSNKYVNKANNGQGGVGYEKMILTSKLLENINDNKIIPIIKQNGTHNVPTFLKTKLFIDLSADDSFEFNYDELARTIHQMSLYIKPEISNNPFTPIKDEDIKPSIDNLKELMRIIVNNYQRSITNTYNKVEKDMNISKIMLDLIIKEAINRKLIVKNTNDHSIFNEPNTFILTDNGKEYAIEHKL